MKLPKDRELGCGQVAEVEGRFKWFQMNTMKKGYRPIWTNVTWLKYFDGWHASSIIQHYQRINVLWDQGVTAQLADWLNAHEYIYIYMNVIWKACEQIRNDYNTVLKHNKLATACWSACFKHPTNGLEESSQGLWAANRSPSKWVAVISTGLGWEGIWVQP